MCKNSVAYRTPRSQIQFLPKDKKKVAHICLLVEILTFLLTRGFPGQRSVKMIAVRDSNESKLGAVAELSQMCFLYKKYVEKLTDYNEQQRFQGRR